MIHAKNQFRGSATRKLSTNTNAINSMRNMKMKVSTNSIWYKTNRTIDPLHCGRNLTWIEKKNTNNYIAIVMLSLHMTYINVDVSGICSIPYSNNKMCCLLNHLVSNRRRQIFIFTTVFGIRDLFSASETDARKGNSPQWYNFNYSHPSLATTDNEFEIFK